VRQEIRAFEDRARVARCPMRTCWPRANALCSVSTRQCSTRHGVPRVAGHARSLWVTFHRESSGGEKVFQIIDRVLNDPRRYSRCSSSCISVCPWVSRGGNRVERARTIRLTEIRHDVFRCVQTLRGTPRLTCTPQWKGCRGQAPGCRADRSVVGRRRGLCRGAADHVHHLQRETQ